jgi:thiamine-monophosphate kinase
VVTLFQRQRYSNVAVPLPEKALIAGIRLSTARGRSHPAIAQAMGDDCAVLRLPSHLDSLVTTDFTLEGIHFRRDWHPAEVVGHRCLARGLSDIAAMGGEPVAVFLSLALPRDLPQSWIGRFTRSLIALAKKHGATLAGGDTAESPNGILADIVVVGSVPKGRAILRSGARPGDRIYVSGELGGSAAALAQLQAIEGTGRHPERKRPSAGARACPEQASPAGASNGDLARTKATVDPRSYPRHFYPEPRVELGRILREKKLASAMIDLSDGLSTDLAHICEESHVGAELSEALIPRARVGQPARTVDLALALHGGEDYELLFTVPPGKRIPTQIAGVPLTQIGHITRSRCLSIANPKNVAHELVPQGWEHFRR